jgi:cytochrome c-type biogenesis protein CcmH/NrfG
MILPARVYLADAPLRDGTQAFARGDCPRAMASARDSLAALDVQAAPYLLIGYCDVQRGRPRRAIDAMSEAVRLDPDSWKTHYGLALARAAGGLDPRPQARVARRLKPRDIRSVELLRLFDTDQPRQWKARAPRARIPHG